MWTDRRFGQARGTRSQAISPSQHVTKKEELLHLADALTEFPDAQRDAVIRRHLQGLSLAEVARQLSRTESAVAGLVYRGLNKLHDLGRRYVG